MIAQHSERHGAVILTCCIGTARSQTNKRTTGKGLPDTLEGGGDANPPPSYRSMGNDFSRGLYSDPVDYRIGAKMTRWDIGAMLFGAVCYILVAIYG